MHNATAITLKSSDQKAAKFLETVTIKSFVHWFSWTFELCKFTPNFFIFYSNVSVFWLTIQSLTYFCKSAQSVCRSKLGAISMRQTDMDVTSILSFKIYPYKVHIMHSKICIKHEWDALKYDFKNWYPQCPYSI